MSSYDLHRKVTMSKPRMTGPVLKVLKLLLEQPRCPLSGAQISKATKVGSGTLYPALQRLEIANWITGEWEDVDPAAVGRPKRRLYTLTKTGQVEAKAALEALQTHAVGLPSWT
jgi:PadR family transcriptional regulator PadR